LGGILIEPRQAAPKFRLLRGRQRNLGIFQAAPKLNALNRLLVRGAEDLVFCRDDYAWVKPFISKHPGYHVGTRTQELNTEGGAVLISQQKVVQRQ
jgi:hypothetical protein